MRKCKPMSPPIPNRYDGTEVFDYLCVDEFMQDVVGARALATAFELGLIDDLIESRPSTFDELEKRCRIDRRGLRLLTDMLIRNGVIERWNGEISLCRQFVRALQYRDLLEAKITFANYVAPDFTELFSSLINSPDRFFQKARIFDLFSYNRCIEYSPENYKLTKRWMRITTILTKYEAAVCMKYHDFSPYGHIIDIGGNSGEFVLRICKNRPHIQATVLDLPVVCDIGMEHIGSEPEADRITFIKGNALTDVLPYGFDLITFKSMLHDWPENQARQLIANAQQALKPGGTLLIFERGPLEFDETTIPYSMIPFIFFFRSYRSPEIYEKKLEDLGFQDIETQRIELEMPFFLITGIKT